MAQTAVVWWVCIETYRVPTFRLRPSALICCPQHRTGFGAKDAEGNP